MKRLLYSLLLFVVFPFLTKAQSTVFTENFDGGGIQFTSTGVPGWATDNTIFLSPSNSWRGQYSINGTTSTTTTSFNTTGNQFVTLNFSQICKVDFVDVAKIEISTDGVTWTQLIASSGGNCFYNGLGNFIAQGNKFTEASYLDWDPAAPTFPLNTWWKQESFDISQLAGNQATVQIRFTIIDNFGNGMNNRAGWFLDDVNVVMAPCEQTPPTIALTAPIWQGNVYTLQQFFDVFAYLTDQSGISQNFGDNELFWTINSDPTVNQAFGLINLSDSLWAGTIYNPNGPFVDGDTVCYWLQAIDASGCNNTTLFPTTGCIQFIIHDGIAFPFCDNFDIGGPFWTADSINSAPGSSWLIGVPNQSVLNNPHSPPNVLGIDLTGSYQPSAQCYVNSVPFDFSAVSNAVLTFWHNRNTESFWDGVNLQFTIDGGATWNVIGTFPDPNGTNWYNTAQVNSSNGQPVWEGQSNGWLESRYKLGSIPSMMNAAQVTFRFQFTSDPSVQLDGFNADDFCIKIPCDNDLGVNAYISPIPNSGLPAGAAVPLTIELENYGNITQTATTISYSLNNGVPVTFAWTGSLAPGAVTTVLLPTSVIVPASGNFDICTWVELPGDCDLTNDTVCATFTAVPLLTPTYCDDFEAANIGWSIANEPGSGPGTIWELGTPSFGQTFTANSGVGAWDINLTSSYNVNAQAYLYSPFFDFSAISAGRISFALNWNTQTFGDGARLEYTTDNGVTWNVLGTGSTLNPDPCGTNWYTNDNFGFINQFAWDGTSSTIAGNVNGWVNCNYGLCCSNNVFNNPIPVQFRFVFISDGFGALDGVSMDDFCITASNGDDLSVSTIVSPLSSVPANLASNVEITVTNVGSSTITAFDANYSINGIPGASPISWTGSLAPCSSVNIIFPGVLFPTGQNTLCGFTILGSDVDLSNDTLCTPIIGIPTLALTYCDDFENGNVGWTATILTGGDPGSIWELGAPTFGTTNSANSGANAWDINLTTAYTNQANTALTSPYLDFSSVSAGRIAFSLNYNSENFWDGSRVEYTTDNGQTWQLLGGGSTANPDPCGTNWYVDDQLNSSTLPAWTGNSGGWVNSSYKLCCTNGIFNNPIPVQFRFVFTSDFSVITDGFSMDDFCVYSSSGADVGISAITSPSGGVPALTSVPVIVTLTNFGSTTVNSTVINYSVNGVAQSPITWNGTLLPCQEISVTLPGFVAISGVNAICAWTELVGDINNANDTICADLIGQPVITPTYLYTYSDNFDNGNIGWAPSVQAGANQTSIWELGTPNFGNTTGAHTPPNSWDVNLNSAVTANANALLTTPYFDLTNAQASIMRFWMNRAMNTFGDLFYIDYTVDNGATWTKLGSNTTPNTTNWYNNTFNDVWDGNSGSWLFTELKDLPSVINNPSNALVQFRFVFITGGFSTPDGASIDDFELFVPIPTSITPITVNTSIPNTLIIPAQPVSFAAPIKNNGLNPIFSHNATLRIDGVIISTDPISYLAPGLLADSSMIHSFANTWIASPGYHEVCVYTDSPNGGADLKPTDDTTCITVLVFDTIPYTAFPYCNSFESGNQWVTLNALTYQSKSTWQQGAPTQPFLGTAHTGTNAWSVILDSNYVNTDSSGLFSSIFRVQANHCYHLTFWQQFRMEFGSDGGAVDYSVDYGTTWNRIDYTGTPNIVNWGPNTNYTYVSALDPTDPSQSGFTGIRNNWFQVDKTFRPGVDGQMIIRWRFASDFSGREEGWSIDDVCLEDLGPCTPLGVNDYAIGEFGLSQNYPNPAVDATSFEYMIPKNGAVKIVVNDIVGKLITTLVDGEQSTGKHVVDVTTKNFAPGVYTYTLTYGEQQVTKRMVITK